MAQLVMLALQQMMQCQRLHRALRPRPVGFEPLRDDVDTPCDALQLRLESGCFLAIGVPRAAVARREFEGALPRRAVLSPGFYKRMTQDLAVTLGRDWQTMFEIPRRKAAFGVIVTKLDLTFLQRLSIRGAQDRHQNARPCSVGKYVPVDVK